MIVVISQSANHQPKLRDHEESLVTHLLLEAKCEVNLVPDLANLESDSTGLLCLEGIRGSMFLLSWHDSEQAISYLAQHGIRGRLVEHANDQQPKPGPGVYDPMQRTIHHATLDLSLSMEDYQENIEAAGRDSKVRTVTLGSSDFPQATRPVLEPDVPDATPVAPVPKRSQQRADEPGTTWTLTHFLTNSMTLRSSDHGPVNTSTVAQAIDADPGSNHDGIRVTFPSAFTQPSRDRPFTINSSPR